MGLRSALEGIRARRLPTGGVAANSVWGLANVGVTAAAVFAETIVLARYLQPEQLGVFLLAIAYPEMVQQLLDFRVRDAMTKYLSEFLAHNRLPEAVSLVKVLWVVDAVIGAIALLIVLATAGLAAELLVDQDGVARLMTIYALGAFIASLDSASGSLLRVVNRFGLAFGAGALAYAGRLGLVVGVTLAGGGLEALMWARVGGELLLTLLLGGASLMVLRSLLWNERHSRMSLLKGRSREIRSFLITTNFTGVVRMASSKLDTLLVGLLASPSTVAIYKVALQFSQIPLLVSEAMHVAVYPAFARDFARGRIWHIREVARRASIYVAAFALPVTLIVAVQAEALIGAVVGQAFREAGTPLVICLVGVLPYVIFFWLYPVLLTTGHPGAFLKIITAGTFAQLVAIIVLVPGAGAPGAAVGFALMYIITVALGLEYVFRKKLLTRDEPGVPGGASTPLDPASPPASGPQGPA